NFVGPRPNAPPDPVGQDRPRAASYELALCNNSGFGGANCAVVVGRAQAAAAQAARIEPVATRAVYIAGVGAVGPHGTAPRLEAIAPSINPRGFDPAMRTLIAAAALALGDAGLRVRGELRDRTGLIVGMNHVSPDSHAQLQRTIDERGLRYLSATMFARM